MRAVDLRPDHACRRGPGNRPGRLSRRVAVLLGAAVAIVALVAGPSSEPARADPAPTSDSPGVVWSADSSSDLLSAFDRTEFNEESGPPEVVPSPNIEGRRALQFTVPPGGERSELLPRTPQQLNGQVLYFGYNGVLAQDFPVDAPAYQIIMQWHQVSDEGSPPVAIQVDKGQLFLAGGGNNSHEGFEVPIGPAEPGQPVNLALRILFSKHPEEGSIDVWSNGRKVVSGYQPPSGTAYDEGNYLKVGMYRDTSLDGQARVFVNNVAVGTNLASVMQQTGQPVPPGAESEDSSSSSSGARGSGGWSPWSVALGAAGVVVVVALVVSAVRRRRTNER